MPDGDSQPWARVGSDFAPLQNSRDTDAIPMSIFWENHALTKALITGPT